AVARIRPCLLASDIELHGAVDIIIIGGGDRLFLVVRNWRWFRGRQSGRALEPCGFQIFQQAFLATLAAVSAFAVAAEAAGSVEQVGAIYPDDAGFELRRNVQRNVDALAPHASRETVLGVVGKLDRFTGSAESHSCKNG